MKNDRDQTSARQAAEISVTTRPQTIMAQRRERNMNSLTHRCLAVILAAACTCAGEIPEDSPLRRAPTVHKPEGDLP